MWVRFDACVSAVAAEAGLDPDRVTQDAINIKRWINDTRRELHNLPTPLSATEFVGEFVGVANVTAGTIKATQNQAEVTGSSTSWTAGMAGRYINIASGQWQRVSYVTDATHLTLESSYNAGTVTGASYTLWKREYAMPHKVEKILNIFDMGNARYPLAYYDMSEFYQKYGFGDSFNPPLAYTQFSSSELGWAYTAGIVFASITSTANSPLLDFTSTTVLTTAVAPGDRIILGDSTTSTAFSVDRVLTDTRLAMKELATISNAALSASAFASDRLLVRTYPAIDNTNIYYFEGYKRCYDIINNSDLLENGWYDAVKKGAIAKALGYVRDPREELKLGEYSNAVTTLIRNHYKAKNPASRLKPYIPRRYGSSGYFPSKYDTIG